MFNSKELHDYKPYEIHDYVTQKSVWVFFYTMLANWEIPTLMHEQPFITYKNECKFNLCVTNTCYMHL